MLFVSARKHWTCSRVHSCVAETTESIPGDPPSAGLTAKLKALQTSDDIHETAIPTTNGKTLEKSTTQQQTLASIAPLFGTADHNNDVSITTSHTSPRWKQTSFLPAAQHEIVSVHASKVDVHIIALPCFMACKFRSLVYSALQSESHILSCPCLNASDRGSSSRRLELFQEISLDV